MTAKNQIPILQLRPELVALLRARYRAFRDAKVIQGLLLSLTILLPVVGVLTSAKYPETRPYLALAALVLLLLDVGLIDPRQKDRQKRGAKLQEEFDVNALSLPWNKFVAGTKVDHEDVHAASAWPLSKAREAQLTPWYEPCVGDVPLPFGRLICQRTNITYDARLRRRYGSALLYAAIALSVVLLFVGMALEPKFSAMVLTFGVPITPVLSWGLREYRKQMDAAEALLNLKSEFEKLWEKALNGASLEELDKGSRELQDAIYRHRASSPLVFDWVYDHLRKANEGEAHHAAQKLVAQAKATITGEKKA